MGNCCGKKSKKNQPFRSDSLTHKMGLDDRQSIFMKSKMEKFKKGVLSGENPRNKGIFENIPLDEEEKYNYDNGSVSKTTSEVDEEESPKKFGNNIRLSDSKSSDMTPRVGTDEYSDSKMFNDVSGTMESQFSKSQSGSKINDIFTLKDPGQYQKGKVIDRNEEKAIYQCMHKSTGKLLIAKTYFVNYSHPIRLA